MNKAVRTGDVAWTGDNPFIYLKEDEAGDWSSLSVFFRIAASKHGPGRAFVIVEKPYAADEGEAVRVVLTDNEPLARFLVDDFVSKFVLFRPSEVMSDLTYVTNATFSQSVQDDDWTETGRAPDWTIDMVWRGLGKPFGVDVPAPESGTGQHEMFAVFRIAEAGEVHVNGRRLSGATIERDFLNGKGQSAGMAISETWIEDPQ